MSGIPLFDLYYILGEDKFSMLYGDTRNWSTINCMLEQIEGMYLEERKGGAW